MAFPAVEFLQFPVGTDPSGYRQFSASGFILGTSLTNFLDFGNVNISTSGRISNTKLVLFRASDMGDASGIYNMRFYLNNAAAFTAGNYRFLHRISTHYLGNTFGLSLADTDIPTTVPAQNLLSTRNQPFISGISDIDVSQYIYLAVYIDRDVPFGTKGIDGFTYRMIFDFS